MMDYIMGGVFLFSLVTLVVVGWRQLRSSKSGKTAVFVKNPQDLDVVRKKMARVYTLVDFEEYSQHVEPDAPDARPLRRLSKREMFLKQLSEAVSKPDSIPNTGSLPNTGGDANTGGDDYPDEDDVDSATMGDASSFAEEEDSGTDGVMVGGELMHPDPSADFFNNKKWKTT